MGKFLTTSANFSSTETFDTAILIFDYRGELETWNQEVNDWLFLLCLCLCLRPSVLTCHNEEINQHKQNTSIRKNARSSFYYACANACVLTVLTALFLCLCLCLRLFLCPVRARLYLTHIYYVPHSDLMYSRSLHKQYLKSTFSYCTALKVNFKFT